MKTIIFCLFLVTLTKSAFSADPTTTSSYSKKDIEDAWNCLPRIADTLLTNSCVPYAGIEKRKHYIQLTSPNCAVECKYAMDPKVDYGIHESYFHLYLALTKYYNNLATDKDIKAFNIEKDRRLKARTTRIEDIRSGKQKISNFTEALIFYFNDKTIKDHNMKLIMLNPLLKPDNEIYHGRILLDYEEQEDFLRVKTIAYRAIPLKYGYLIINEKTVSFNKHPLKLEEEIVLIGRYVGNQKYKTVLDEERTAPMLEVLYLGDLDSLQDVNK